MSRHHPGKVLYVNSWSSAHGGSSTSLIDVVSNLDPSRYRPIVMCPGEGELPTRLRELDIPVLGLCGTEDPFPDQPQQLAGMRCFEEAAAIPGAGRFLHWEQPAAFNHRIRQFIEERL